MSQKPLFERVPVEQRNLKRLYKMYPNKPYAILIPNQKAIRFILLGCGLSVTQIVCKVNEEQVEAFLLFEHGVNPMREVLEKVLKKFKISGFAYFEPETHKAEYVTEQGIVPLDSMFFDSEGNYKSKVAGLPFEFVKDGDYKVFENFNGLKSYYGMFSNMVMTQKAKKFLNNE